MEVTKQDFIVQLGQLLALTKTGASACEYVQGVKLGREGEEYVRIQYENGYSKNVCISCSSHLAIIIDVINQI